GDVTHHDIHHVRQSGDPEKAGMDVGAVFVATCLAAAAALSSWGFTPTTRSPCAAMLGAVLRTSTTTAYIESSAGVEEGGRTALTALVVAALFLLSLFLAPLAQTVPPYATAPRSSSSHA